MHNYRKRAILGMRLIGFFIFLVGFWMFVANVVESADSFNPSYLVYYAMSQLLRPLLACAMGIGIFLFSRRLGAWIACGLDES